MTEQQQNDLPYLAYSAWLKKRYGQKVYKLPVNVGATCPNRDGTLSTGGCIFCGAKGGGNESLDANLSVKEQLLKNKAYIGRRYHAKRFIAFLQDFTNTYMPFKRFEKIINACYLDEDFVGIAVSTRPDCVSDRQIAFLKDFQEQTGLDICVELGLQSVNNHTLKILNRRHSVSDYVDCARRVKQAGLELCTHLIIDLPWDSDDDVIEAAKLVSAVKTDFIKCHSLYIEKGTVLEKMYAAGDVTLLSLDDYLWRAKNVLSYLSPDIAIERIIGRAPKSDTVITNWHTSWWKIRDMLIADMQTNHLKQGDAYQKRIACREALLS